MANLVDGVIDGGFGDNHASTIIDLTELNLLLSERERVV